MKVYYTKNKKGDENMKRWNTQVTFTPLSSCDCKPPIVAGHMDTFWVTTGTRQKAEIITAAKWMAMKAYGIEIKDIVVCGNQFSS